MESKLYLDVNVIQSVPPSCVNRDDTGSPKTAIYGGVRRARVSSQSWKKAMRDEFRNHFDESDLAVRTKKIVDLVAQHIISMDDSVSQSDAIKKATEVLEKAGVSVKTKAKKGKEPADDSTPESQALFFMSQKQADNLASLALEGGYDKKTAQKALNEGCGIEISLFGRMVADDPSLNADASAQVAHSISTHKVSNEYDFYTAVDDRSPDDNAGAGMMGTVEFNSSTLYRYATVAVHDLDRMLDDRGVTAKAVAEFVRAFVISMPTGKQNTFANRTLPAAVFIVARTDQPVNLVSAFERPVGPDRGSGGYNDSSIRRMVEYELNVESEFVAKPASTWQIGTGLEDIGDSSDLESVLAGVRKFIEEL